MEKEQARKVIEVLLYMTDHPLTIQEIEDVIEDKAVTKDMVASILNDIQSDYELTQSGLCVLDVAGGIQVATRPEMASWIRRLYKERLTVKLSPSALETLAIIAYKQPIARSEIEQIRGVEATGVMDTLLERRLIKVVGRKETIGRPLLYGTTLEFLRQFGLTHLSNLPDLATISPSEGTDFSTSESENQVDLETIENEIPAESATLIEGDAALKGTPSQN